MKDSFTQLTPTKRAATMMEQGELEKKTTLLPTLNIDTHAKNPIRPPVTIDLLSGKPAHALEKS